MKVLALTRYGRLGASSRLRTLQYLPAAQTAGIEVTVSELLGDSYVRELYAGRRAVGTVLGGYARRFGQLVTARRYDVLWIEKECLPWLPAWMELALLPHTCRVVADYDDAWFHRYDQHRLALVRRMLGRKIDAVMRRADIVTAGNKYLAMRAYTAGARHVEIVPTVIDVDRYPVAIRDDDCAVCTIGWVGSPTTAGFLKPVAPVLCALASKYRVRCVAVGARQDQLDGTPFEAITWSEATEGAQIQSFDIGIMPLPDEPWTRGKCGYKLIQYMGCGVPVVASAVGANLEIVVPGETGELVRTPAEWGAALERLILDAGLRARMGAAGRKRVVSMYSLQCQASRLVGMLQALVAMKV